MATTTATLDAPTAPATPRRPRTDPNANRKAYDRALRAWATAIVALERAAAASEVLADALGELRVEEMDRIDGEDLRLDANLIGWSTRTHLSLIDEPAPIEVRRMVRAAS